MPYNSDTSSIKNQNFESLTCNMFFLFYFKGRTRIRNTSCRFHISCTGPKLSYNSDTSSIKNSKYPKLTPNPAHSITLSPFANIKFDVYIQVHWTYICVSYIYVIIYLNALQRDKHLICDLSRSIFDNSNHTLCC